MAVNLKEQRTLGSVDPEVCLHQHHNSLRYVVRGKRQAMISQSPFCPLFSSPSPLGVHPAPFGAAPLLVYSPPSDIAHLLAVYVFLVSPECLARVFQQLCAGLSPNGAVLPTYPLVNK